MTLKKLIALLMALAMILAMAACGSEEKEPSVITPNGENVVENNDEADEETDIVGKWVGTMDMTDAMNEVMSATAGMDVELEDIAVELIFNFKKNGELECEIDEDSVEEMAEKLITGVVEMTIQMLEDQGTSLEDIGMTEEDIYDEIAASVDVDELVDSMVGGFGGTYYVYEDGTIYTGTDEDELNEDPEGNAEEIWEVTLKGKTMKITDIINADGDSLNDVVPGVLPMTLKKN